jgi:hypothetical protein
MSDLKKGRRFVVALMLTVISPVAMAARADNAFRVSLTVLSACNVQMQTLNNTPLASTINVSCTKSTPVAVCQNGALVTSEQRQPYTFSAKVLLLSEGMEGAKNPSRMSAGPFAHRSTTGNSQGEEVVDVVY